MFTFYFIIISLQFLHSSKVCIHILTFKTITDVTANCSGNDFIVDPLKHIVKWGTLTTSFEDKYPYFYLKNGSLLVKDISSTSLLFCEVKDLKSNKSLHMCGTSVKIIKPLMLKYTPINETVQKGTKYKINCHGGGGDYDNWKLSYIVNNSVVNAPGPFLINYDTKVECRLESGTDVLSSVAYIKVKREGVMTDEEELLHTTCGVLSTGICHSKFPEMTLRVYSSFDSGRKISEQILKELFQLLDYKIIAEYNEDNCIDRFQRLVCATVYSPCQYIADNAFIKKTVCRESCETTLETICRNTLQRIRKQYQNSLTQSAASLNKVENYVMKEYKRQYILRTLALAKSVFDCEMLPSFRNKTQDEQCSLLNLDIIPASNDTKTHPESEVPSNKCYNNVGRYFTDKVSHSNENSKCINWDRVPQLYIAFYQQNLQNESSYCRNPGGIYSLPMCPIVATKMEGELHLNNIMLIPCKELYKCDEWRKLNQPGIQKGSVGIIVVASVIFIVLFLVAFVIFGMKCMNKKLKPVKKKLLHDADDMALTDDHTQLFDNKVYMYKNVQNGHYSCPIYNSACLERVFQLSDGAYGEILLVQAVFEDSTQLTVDETLFSTNDKNSYRKKSFCESVDNNIDDFILSKDKTFNGKACWPFDKSSVSGCCPFAVIKYCIRCNEQTMESRFAQETKILSLLNHPHIMRFYGVTVNSTGKIISRIIEYLPNGSLYSILTGDRVKPIVVENNDRGKVENGYQTVSALQKSRIKENSTSFSTIESRHFKRKKLMSSQSKEPEPPKPTELIELSQKQLIKWIIEISDAVLYLHGKHLLHRDIATRNCLVGIDLEAKLSDFNFVQKFTIGHDLIGSKYEYIPIRWLPKETLENLIFNIDTDVWMFGIFMWEVMSLGQQPYGDRDLNETCEAIINEVLLEAPSNCSTDIYNQMKLCWVDPNSRPCLETIKKYMKNILDTL